MTNNNENLPPSNDQSVGDESGEEKKVNQPDSDNPSSRPGEIEGKVNDEISSENRLNDETPALPKKSNWNSFRRLFGTGKDLNFPVCVFLSLLSATLMILAFPDTGWYFLAFFGMVPIIILIESQSKWKVFICYFIYLLIFYYYILDWIKVFHPYAVPGLVGYVIVIHYIPLVIYRFFRKWNKIGSVYNAFLFATIMVIFEYCRELGFARFPYGNIGYTQYRFLPLIQIADITGYLGVSYFVYFVNAAIAGTLVAAFINPQREINSYFRGIYVLLFNRFLLIAAIFSALLIYGNRQISSLITEISALDSTVTLTNQNLSSRIAPSEKIRVSLIQHWYDYNIDWTLENRKALLEKLFRITEEAVKDEPDLVIWPESSVNDYYEYRLANIDKNPNSLSVYYREFFRKIGREHPDIKFLVGSLSLGEIQDETIVEKNSRTAKDVKTGSIVGNIKKYNSALLIDRRGKVIDKGAKMLLVPVGEYFPYTAILNAIPWFAGILDEAQASQFTPYDRFKVFNYDKGLFSTLICYEDAFEFLSRTLVLSGASFLVLITNDAWGYSVKSQELHYMFSIFRAIENRRHVLRAGNAGVTGIIDPWGRSDKVLPMFEEGFSTVEFTPNQDYLSLFTRYGNFFIIFVIAIFIILIHYSVILKLWAILLWIKGLLFRVFR